MNLKEKFDLKQFDGWLTQRGFKRRERLPSDFDCISYIKQLGDGEMFLLIKFTLEDLFVWKSTMHITLNDKAGYSMAWLDVRLVRPDKAEEIGEAIDQVLQFASEKLQQKLLTISEYRMTGM